MVWRSIMISRPARLRREHYSLAVEQEQTAFVPFEDIAVIVLNHPEITLTHPVLSACGEYGISLFATGTTHHPSGVFLPFLPHSRATRWMRLQLNLPRPVAKQAWATIVRKKIANQAACLQLANREGIDRLKSYEQRVRSGDSDNLEGQAAAFYFARLFGKDFRRNQIHFVNAALDYGYAVMRGAIARALVSHGLLPSLGLFHASEQNAFNLADDIIEPFRSLVDLFAVNLAIPDDEILQPDIKAALINLLNVDVFMPRGKMSVLSAIEQSVESIARLYERNDKACLELPSLIGLASHQLEY
ncbi:type II CRISPR-associated endonuclease Cas1 [Nitrosomonas nitrosa]|uniref:type II CRISPR-associated endonuclease Cas1 n=1 Tax=Nitrosomonas nitrosa TaxID=52442 RepID=UPI0023F8B774|nr:type II CRISPR-associated endonuclease Cas1 [Nitrosomonas nitrosa]MCO6434912.1 type II CRISPR-associated endonuclease Cas1 [Nitrosomonas nitrosa]